MFFIFHFYNSLFPLFIIFLTSTIHALPDHPDILRCDPRYGTGLTLTACSFALANMPHGEFPEMMFKGVPPDVVAADPNEQLCPLEYMDHVAVGEPLFLLSLLLVPHCYHLDAAIIPF